MALSGHAYVTIDGIYYNIENEEATVVYGESSYTGEVNIPESVMIEDVPYSVTAIGKGAFSGCKYLTSVSIPNSVATIGESAFRSCTGLLELSIDPNPNLYIGSMAFYSCSNLMYVKTTDIAKWCRIRFETKSKFDYYETETSYSNPCSGPGTLYLGAKKITSLEIPNGITEIKSCSFAGCDFTSVTLPSSITSIGKFAFYGCNKLTGVTIPNSVKTIGDYAFQYCSSLKSPDIKIPNSVTSIGKSAFSNCQSLSDISFWPQSATIIDENTFSNCSGLVTSGIPEGVKSIYKNAFWNCKAITNIIVPESLTLLHIDAFDGCESIASVEWNAISCNDYYFEDDEYYREVGYEYDTRRGPFADSRANFHSITFGDHVNRIPAFLCYGLKTLDPIIIPNSVKSIGKRAFTYTSILDEISFGNSLDSIEESAFRYSFYNSSSSATIRRVTIPNSVTYIGDYAFADGQQLTDIYLGNSVREIGEGAFGWCSSLTSINIPNSVSVIGDGAFGSCLKAASINIPNSVSVIGNGAFGNCPEVTSINIPNSVSVIGDHAFANCSKVASITLGSSIESIGAGAFEKCNLITSITIPASVKSLGVKPFPETLTTVEWNAKNCADGRANSTGSPFFSNCTLTSLNFGNEVERIPSNICKKQTALSEISFPASVKAIGANALIGCTGLQKITSHITEPKTVVLGLTDEQLAQLPLYIPKGTTDAYLNALGWADFSNMIEMEGTIVPGDINGDEAVDGNDVSIVLEMVLAGGVTDAQKAMADINADGSVDGNDVSILLDKVLAGE